MRFYLGTHELSWLAGDHGAELFISRNRFERSPEEKWPRAVVPWCLDSGGFTELSRHGRWRIDAARYAERVRRIVDVVGMPIWIAPQDWMCEPTIIATTGLSVERHQRATVDNFVELSKIAPELPIIPVLQGFEVSDYLRCVELYSAAGVDLSQHLVGLGTVCRRQDTGPAFDIVIALRAEGIERLHGFGVKKTGIRRYGSLLESSDSLAWSSRARNISYHGETNPIDCRKHRTCSSCLDFALWYRAQVLEITDGPSQLVLTGNT